MPLSPTPVPSESSCPRCGERIPFDESSCPSCSGRAKKPYPLPLLITALVLVAAALFVLTHLAAASFQAKQDELARQWFERGEMEFRAARVLPAIDDYRNALAYSHQNSRYRLRLAEALEGAGRMREARAYLLALWDEQPGDGKVNLQLARLASRDADENNAVRYYQGAIYGIWEENPEQERRNARMELVNFLIDRHRVRRAEAELIQLSVDLPRNPQVITRVGGLFLQIGDPARALALFQSALQLGPNPGAMAGSAMAAFQLRRYSNALPLLRRAAAENPQDRTLAALLQEDEFIVQFSPFPPHLPAAERSRRVLRLFQVASARLQDCAQQRQIDLQAMPPQNDLQSDALQIRELQPRMRSADFRRNPDLLDLAMDLIERIESDTAKLCGPPTGNDDAILLILRQRETS